VETTGNPEPLKYNASATAYFPRSTPPARAVISETETRGIKEYVNGRQRRRKRGKEKQRQTAPDDDSSRSRFLPRGRSVVYCDTQGKEEQKRRTIMRRRRKIHFDGICIYMCVSSSNANCDISELRSRRIFPVRTGTWIYRCNRCISWDLSANLCCHFFFQLPCLQCTNRLQGRDDTRLQQQLGSWPPA
jgi:hypothetical protein